MRIQNIHRVGIYLRLSRDDGNSNAESMSIPPESVFSPDKPTDDSLYAATVRAIGRLDERELAVVKDLINSLLRNGL